MNILTYSSLYPNKVDPTYGIFVERRLYELVENTDVSATVVSPVPWFPFRSKVFGKYADFAAVPTFDQRHGIEISYPRYPIIPKVGMLSAPGNMARATARTLERLLKEHAPVGLIDAHYFYPDGVAASRLAEHLQLPFIVTARGSDINLIAEMARPRKMILEAADKAKAIVAVSKALGRSLQALGVEADKIHIIPNGVDLSFFHPGDRDAARRKLMFDTPTFISVGALKEAKGHDVAIEALRYLDDAKLVIIGTGEHERSLKKMVTILGLQSRVTFTGQLSPDALLEYYQAADALFLISRREGMPNVVLESIACGTPVIAANVGGINEIVNAPLLGALLSDRKPRAAAEAWRALSQRGVDRAGIRKAAESFSWDKSTEMLYSLMRNCVGKGGH